jgi:hypothetical protein
MTKSSRRQFLSHLSKTAVAIPLSSLFTQTVYAADAVKVDPEGAQAKALKYVHQSEVEDQLCKGCQLYSDSDTEGWGNCAIFPGKVVDANGWCASWVKTMS